MSILGHYVYASMGDVFSYQYSVHTITQTETENIYTLEVNCCEEDKLSFSLDTLTEISVAVGGPPFLFS